MALSVRKLTARLLKPYNLPPMIAALTTFDTVLTPAALKIARTCPESIRRRPKISIK